MLCHRGQVKFPTNSTHFCLNFIFSSPSLVPPFGASFTMFPFTMSPNMMLNTSTKNTSQILLYFYTINLALRHVKYKKNLMMQLCSCIFFSKSGLSFCQFEIQEIRSFFLYLFVKLLFH